MKIPEHLLPLNPHLARAVVVSDSPYRSQLEARAVRDWLPTQGALQWFYEPLAFILPGGRYTPDIMLITANGTFVFVEVKGYSASIRASRKAFLEAAHTHRWARWLWLTWDKRAGWVEKWAGE